jgi:nitroimidazol reductase NimA-like FMN-containing flavoprotein (pyridoxamine 5'-phosphate oxidase superfamily)
MGFLATVGEDGQPFLNSNLFVFDEERHCLYMHTHRTGRTRDNVAGNGRVAFSAAAMGRLLPAPEALEFSVEYCGVVAFGRGTIVEDTDEARHGLRILLEKYAPHLRYGGDYRATTDEELRRTAVYRIDIEAWSGKQKEVEEDFPGAFDLPPVPVPFPERSEAAGSASSAGS